MSTTRPARSLQPAVIALAIGALAYATPALAIWEIAEGEVFLSAEAGIAGDSNIVGNSSEVSDTVFSFAPTATYLRDRGRGSINLSVGSTIERYDENSNQDSESYRASFNLDMPATPSGRLRGSLRANYSDSTQLDQYLGDRIDTKSHGFGLNGQYQATSKVNARFGTNYNRSEPDGGVTHTNRSYTVGAGYNIRPALSTFLDLRITDSSTERNLSAQTSDISSQALLIGLDGEITPKISGHIGVGFEQGDFETGGVKSEDEGFTMDMALTWNPRQRTSAEIAASRDFRVTSIAASAIYTNYRLTISQEIGASVNATAGVTYSTSEFTSTNGREDDVLGLNLGVTYAMNRYFSFGASFAHTQSSSNQGLFDYGRDLWRIYATARF